MRVKHESAIQFFPPFRRVKTDRYKSENVEPVNKFGHKRSDGSISYQTPLCVHDIDLWALSPQTADVPTSHMDDVSGL